jgi:ribosomal protein S18 acetylase RimI-like enzyme
MDAVVFREVRTDDVAELRTLHEQFFPVRYSEKFYEGACHGIGLRGLPLYSIIATKEDRIVGFLLSQFLPLSVAEDRDAIDVFSESKKSDDTEVMYILTLGCIPKLRHLGIASAMIKMCESHCRNNPQCGALYLHVIVSNRAAIGFYEKNGFIFYRTRYNYYEIGGLSHTAYLYLLPLNDFAPVHSLYHRFWMLTDRVVRSISSFSPLRPFRALSRTPPAKIRDLPPDINYNV